MTGSVIKPGKRFASATVAVVGLACLGGVGDVSGADGSWTSDAAGNWSIADNWAGGAVADGAGATGCFTNDITDARTITIDGAVASRTLGILNIGDADGSASFTIAADGDGILTFDNSGSIAQLNQVVTSTNNAINAPLALVDSIAIDNASTCLLTLSGSITSAVAGVRTIANVGTGIGGVTISGVIGNGTGTVAILQCSGSSPLILTGTNTYSGATMVSNGTLLVDGILGAGGGAVTVTTNGVLGGTGIIARAVVIAAGKEDSIGGCIAPGGTNVGTLTINGNFTFIPTNNVAQQPVWSVQLSAVTNDRLVVNGSFIMTNTGQVTLEIANAGGALPNGKTYTLMTWTNANPVGGMAQFQVVHLDPNWSGGIVTVDTSAKKVLLGDLVDRIANITATNVTDTTADLVGNLTATGAAATKVWAFWDTTDQATNKTWAHSTNFMAGSLGPITNSITSLSPNQTNYFTYYASNAEGEVWAQPSLSFKTWGPPEVDYDGGPTEVWNTNATLRGTLLNGNGAFITAMWGTDQGGLANTGAPVWVAEGIFSIPIDNLVSNTTYYYQYFVSNGYGTVTSPITNFTTKYLWGCWYVATNGPVEGDGKSWSQAFTNIQQALDEAQDNHQILLAGHTFWITNELRWGNMANVSIKGGWEGAGAPLGSNNPTLWPTAIQRNPVKTTRIFRIDSVTGTLMQVTIKGGKNDYSLVGGGIWMTNSIFTFDGCQVVSNEVYGNASLAWQWCWIFGGALYAVNSDVVITNCDFVGNRLYGGWRRNENRGGGCYFAGGSAAILASRFINNKSTGAGNPSIPDYSSYGGAIYANCPLTITASEFAGNSATIGSGPCSGGAIYAAKALSVQASVFVGGLANQGDTNTARGAGIYAATNATLRNVLIANNTVGGTGGGLYFNGGLLQVNAATIAGNSGEGIFIRQVSRLGVTNSIFWDNTDDLAGFPTNSAGVLTNVFYCDIKDGDNTATNGCLSVDPLFVDTNYYHLQSKKGNYVGGYFSGGSWGSSPNYSPCLDVGDPASDYSQEPAFDGRRVNLGAYANTPVASRTPRISGIVIWTR